MTVADTVRGATRDAPSTPPRLGAGDSGGSPAPAGSPGRSRRDARASASTSGLLLAGLSAALGSLHPLLAGFDWWLAGTVGAAAVLGAAALVRARTRSALLPPLAGLLAAVAGLTATFGWGTGFLGVLPTADTLTRWNELAAAGRASIQEQAVPAEPVAGIVFLVVLGVVALALVADILAVGLRHPALAVLPFVMMLAVVPAVREGVADGGFYIATAVCYLLLLRIGAGRMPTATVLVTGAIVVLGSLVAPTVLPPVEPQENLSGTGLQTRANPFITLGDDLRRGDPVVALEYTTEAEQPVYLRLATLEQLDGETWRPNEVDAETAGAVDAFPSPAGLDGDAPRTAASVDVSVSLVGGRWLPVPYPATSIEGLEGEWRTEPSGLTVRAFGSGTNGQEYRVDYLETAPTEDQLRAAPGGVPDRFAQYLSVPGEVDPIVESTAREVVSGAATAYDQARLLQDFFRSEFAYSEETPVDDGYDGSGIGVLPAFLETQSGYCVHFSSAMTVMARQLGIPARIAVGFLPGDSAPVEEGTGLFRVSSDDLHAWPELYFEGWGWTRFEPTPTRGAVPAYAAPVPVDDPATPQDESILPPSAIPSAAPGDAPRIDEGDVLPGAAGSTDSGPALLPVAVGLGVVLLLLVPAGIRALLRARRMRRIRSGRGAAQAAWTEVRETARDHGWLAPPTETAREFAERLSIVLDDAGPEVERLTGAVERQSYARAGGTPLSVEELRIVLRAIARHSGWSVRVRAILLPPSLLNRITLEDRVERAPL